jgi:hypothetical protein
MLLNINSIVVTIYLTINISTLLTHIGFACFGCTSDQQQLFPFIALTNFFTYENERVDWALQTDTQNVIQVEFNF